MPLDGKQHDFIKRAAQVEKAVRDNRVALAYHKHEVDPVVASTALAQETKVGVTIVYSGIHPTFDESVATLLTGGPDPANYQGSAGDKTIHLNNSTVDDHVWNWNFQLTFRIASAAIPASGLVLVRYTGVGAAQDAAEFSVFDAGGGVSNDVYFGGQGVEVISPGGGSLDLFITIEDPAAPGTSNQTVVEQFYAESWVRVR